MPFNRPIPESKPTGKIASGIGAVVEAEKAMQMALMLPSAVFIGWLGGAWADHQFHQAWMMIAGVCLGAVSGLVYIIRLVISSEKNSRPGAVSGDGTGKGSGNSEP